ncbi:MAG: carboxymuconolactone decarboxylase family protein [Anaerolineales bacterium]
MSQLPKPYQQFRKDHPDIYKAYEDLGEITAESGPLDIKTRELIKLGMAAATKSESAVQSHTHRALEAGATAAEIEHTLMIGINMFGFSTMMTALTWAKQAIASRTK